MRKKFVSLLLIIALFVPIETASATSVEVPVKSDVDNIVSTIMDMALVYDGFETENCSERLLNVFLENTKTFFDVLNQYEEAEQNLILSLVAENAAITQSDEFLELLFTLNPESVPYQKLLISYENALNVINSVSDTESYDVPQYDIDTITALASAYLENGNTENMELFTLLADAYQKEPALVGDAISTAFSYEEQEELAVGIVKACTEIETKKISGYTEVNDVFQKTICQAIAEREKNASVSVPLAMVYTPEITSFSYSGTIEVGKATPLTIKLTEESGTAASRSYTVKVYCTRGGTEYQFSSVSMTIPKNSTTASKTINLTFSHAGTFTTRVAVYSGSTLLVTREGRSPDISYGRWKITCTFQKDRTQYGSFALYNAAGELQKSGKCLGLSVKNIDENLPYGNTPCGTYTGYLTGPVTGGDNPKKYGPNKCVDANAVNVPCINNGTRNDGMWIHGGRSQTKLQPTDGCVRVFDNDMLDIQKSIESMTLDKNGHYRIGDVIYREM